MTEYYLIVTEWQGSKRKSRFDLVKRIDTHSRKAIEAGKEYEKELNGGFEGSSENLVSGKAKFTVCASPMSEAREYKSFNSWECNIRLAKGER